MLSRRTRHLVRTRATLEASLYLLGVVYNFCSAHGSLGSKSAIRRTLVMAAGLTQHVWTVGELLWHRIPPERWLTTGPPRTAFKAQIGASGTMGQMSMLHHFAHSYQLSHSY